MAAAPLKSGDQVLGTIGMAYGVESERAFSDAEVELLSRFAELASLALDNARLFTQTQEQARRLALLNQMGEQLNRNTDLGKIFDIAAENISRILPADHADVALLNDARDGVQVIDLDSEAVASRQGATLPLQGSGLEQVILKNQSIVRSAVQIDDSPPNLCSQMNVPLLAGGQTIGSLNLTCNRPHAFNDNDRNIVVQLASLLSSAIENELKHPDYRVVELDEPLETWMSREPHDLVAGVHSTGLLMARQIYGERTTVRAFGWERMRYRSAEQQRELREAFTQGGVELV